MGIPAEIEWLSAVDIQPALRCMVGDDTCLSGRWTAEQLPGGMGDGLGVWRIAGCRTTEYGEQQWSMVLKGWDCSNLSGSPSGFDWPLREAELYRSGVLNALPVVVAPTCFGSTERNGSLWIWIEDLTGVPHPRWTVDDYAKAARYLGRFNGTYLAGEPIPNNRSLSDQWLAGLIASAADVMASLDEYLHDPFVSAIFPAEVRSGYYRIWDQRQTILDGLGEMPQTFCHLDVFYGNTFFRERDGEEEMVLIDWSFAGTAAVGEELAALCVADATFTPGTSSKFDAIERAAFNAYMEGLRDAGAHVDEERVWHAYRSAALLRYGPGVMNILLPLLTNNEGRKKVADSWGVPFNHLQEYLARYCRWLAEHGQEI